MIFLNGIGRQLRRNYRNTLILCEERMWKFKRIYILKNTRIFWPVEQIENEVQKERQLQSQCVNRSMSAIFNLSNFHIILISV